MVLGTASHVGKSLIAAALCRIFSDEGYRVAPFKAQNMSLNSAATPDGAEIGRAQAMQAEAARITATADMNPILLKPTSSTGSQVVLLGKVQGVEQAADYHRRRVATWFPPVVAAYERLAAKHDIIVIEGAGSPAEINLKATDIVNMRMADAADARCLLVGDIDRGGVFASLLGTMMLLEPSERARIAAFAINKFRGDLTLLAPGVVQIEERMELPCAGVIPWLHEVGLDEEDSVSLTDQPRVAQRGWTRSADPARALRVAIILLPYLANATDFAALAAEPELDVAYVADPADLHFADLVIVPGTKDTIGALRWLHANDFAQAIPRFSERGIMLGICGGLQILGSSVADPHGVEGGGKHAGLGLLPVGTVLAKEKITREVRVHVRDGGWFGVPSEKCIGSGYEIHMGESTVHGAAFADVDRGTGGTILDGSVSANGRIVGTYVHGLFAEDAMRHAFLRAARAACGLQPPQRFAPYAAERDARFDRLAAHVRAALDLTPLLA